jgi:hypothetical protein
MALIHATDNKAMPGAWLAADAVLALLATLAIVPGNRARVEKATLPALQ